MLPPTGKKYSEDKKTDFDRNSFDKRSEHDEEVMQINQRVSTRENMNEESSRQMIVKKDSIRTLLD